MRRPRFAHVSLFALLVVVAVGCGGDEDSDAGLFGGTAGAGAGDGQGAGSATAGRAGSATSEPGEPAAGKGGTGGKADPGSEGGEGGTSGSGSAGGSVTAGAGGAGATTSNGGAGGTGAGNEGGSSSGVAGTSNGNAGSDAAGAGGKASAGAGGGDPAGAGGSDPGGAAGAAGAPPACTNTADYGSMAQALDVGVIADNGCTGKYNEKQLSGPGDEDWIRYQGSDTLGTGCATEPFAELVSGNAGEVCVFLQPVTPASGGIVCLSGTSASSNGITGCCSKSLARLQFGRYLGVDDATVWVVVRGAQQTCAPYRVELGYGGLRPAASQRRAREGRGGIHLAPAALRCASRARHPHQGRFSRRSHVSRVRPLL